MKKHFFLSSICILILLVLAAAPALAAMVLCPSGCSCLLPAEAAKINTPGLCGGKQMVCASEGKMVKYCYTRPVNATTTTALPLLIATGFHPVPATTTAPASLPMLVTGMQVITTTPLTTAVPVAGATRIAVHAACSAGCTCLITDKADAAGYKHCSASPATCGYDPVGQQMFCYSTGPAVVIELVNQMPPSMRVPAVISTAPTSSAQTVSAVSRREIAFAKLAGSPPPQSSMPSQRVLCNGSLVNTWTDPSNCGSCGAFCTGGLVCGMGQCIYSTGPSAMQAPCSPFQIQCNSTCSYYLHDDENCGGCGNRCGVFETCCGGHCTNTNNDSANCHDCGTVCGENAACSYGLCTCINSTTRCGTACADPLINEEHCGGCNIRCGAGEACCAGHCIDVTRNAMNCGTCNHNCGTGIYCRDGRCVDPETNEEHCGDSDTPCGEDQVCCNGVCMDFRSNPGHCGSCGNRCYSGQSCIEGECINLLTDENNCGSLGNYCYWDTGGNTCCYGRCVDLDFDNHNCGICGKDCPWDYPYCMEGDCWSFGDMLLLLLIGG